jgi:hypothetical protein
LDTPYGSFEIVIVEQGEDTVVMSCKLAEEHSGIPLFAGESTEARNVSQTEMEDLLLKGLPISGLVVSAEINHATNCLVIAKAPTASVDEVVETVEKFSTDLISLLSN